MGKLKPLLRSWLFKLLHIQHPKTFADLNVGDNIYYVLKYKGRNVIKFVIIDMFKENSDTIFRCIRLDNRTICNVRIFKKEIDEYHDNVGFFSDFKHAYAEFKLNQYIYNKAFRRDSLAKNKYKTFRQIKEGDVLFISRNTAPFVKYFVTNVIEYKYLGEVAINATPMINDQFVHYHFNVDRFSMDDYKLMNENSLIVISDQDLTNHMPVNHESFQRNKKRR